MNYKSLTTIKNYTTLKLGGRFSSSAGSLTTIKNYTTLKLVEYWIETEVGLTTIKNYTTLKHQLGRPCPAAEFDYHKELHYSQT